VNRAPLKPGLHPRNCFRERYDFPALITACPSLASHVRPAPHGELSLDFADPLAVKTLNQALLKQAYGLEYWDIPPGNLCPPIPGRSDYIHYLADLISGQRGSAVRVLDVGSGANCIYPLIGASEYGWSFIAAELDPQAHRWAEKLVKRNPTVASLIDCRLQKSATECFRGVVSDKERLDLTMCNPPFHSSAAEAAEGALRKQKNLGQKSALLNFGGQSGELWCAGGELDFIRRMITQSLVLAPRCRWFSTLVSKSAHLPRLQLSLKHVKATQVKIIEMSQGQKKSRILAWTFQ
jgi:23S rRNA (adenine1618-N6)-methyltransferase